MMENKNDLIGQPKLYDPGIYAIFGFFLSIVPVLYMSWSNGRSLPDPVKHHAAVKKYALLFLGLLMAYFIVDGWAVSVATRGLTSAIMENPAKGYYATVSGDFSRLNSPEIAFARNIIDNASVIYLALNLALLIFFLKYTGKLETEFFREGLKNKTLKGRTAWLPLFVGLLFMVGLYMLDGPLTEAIAKIFLK